MKGARVAKINAHPGGGIEPFGFFYADFSGSGFVLRFPGEHIVVAALAIMQKGAYGGQKLERGSEPVSRRIGKWRGRTGAFPIECRKQCHPRRDVIVSQSAGSLFDVW